MERGLVQGLTAFRWAAWGWMAAVLLVSRHRLERPWLAVTLVGLALAVTVAGTARFRLRPDALLRPGPVAVELAVGAALVLGDGWAYGADHAFSTSQSLGSVWPLAGVLMAGIALGPWLGAAGGVVLGLARVGATLANGVREYEAGRILSLTNTIVFYAVAGGVAGYVVCLLRRAEQEISTARAREELARTLHDGVLQTLAVVERRADDPALARLARDQERELRDYLFGDATGANGSPPGAAELAAALRAAAARFEQSFGGRAEVVLAGEVDGLGPAKVDALAGAVGEALTNAGKHGAATRATVFVDPEDSDRGIFCSVKDDGSGFDPATTAEGVGLGRSIRGRMEELGGRAEVASAPGEGTEVRLWLPE
ncbi:MAG: ATP-binding protein [Actinomycetota bacterium]|nr:ATP-binding protein [Actinomycetota bacterium]